MSEGQCVQVKRIFPREEEKDKNVHLKKKTKQNSETDVSKVSKHCRGKQSRKCTRTSSTRAAGERQWCGKWYPPHVK